MSLNKATSRKMALAILATILIIVSCAVAQQRLNAQLASRFFK